MQNWTQALKSFLNVFLKSKCPICQRQADRELCEYCYRQLQRCQLPNPQQFWQGELPVFTWGVYGGVLKRTIAALKYDNQPQLARPLGQYLGEAWIKSSLVAQKAIVVPIPLHANKQKQRGFNQADLIAESFCQFANLPLQKQGLVRVKETKAQFSLSAADRTQNLAGAFKVGNVFLQKPPTASILLLDDIYTTGETARTAARILRKQGIQVCGIVAIATSKKE